MADGRADSSWAERGHFISGMLVFGTVTGVTMKMQLDSWAIGWGGIDHKFAKPFFQTLTMFLAMSGSILFYKIQKSINGKRAASPMPTDYSVNNVNIDDDQIAKKQRKDIFLIAVPTIFDLTASTLMTFGLIPLTASIFQMLRGSMVIFSAILSVIFLKRKLFGYHYIGIVLCTISLFMVGVAGIHSQSPGDEYPVTQMILGCLLVVGSQFIQAGQIVAEEFILKEVEAPPMKIVGWEGIWGTLMTALIACPIAYLIPGDDPSTMPGGSLENTLDSFIQLAHNWPLLVIVIVFMVAVLLYNIYGMTVTNSLTAVHRTIFEAMRTACIWVTDLVIFIIWPSSGFGEEWNIWSWLELSGFLVMVLSSFIYNGILRIPGITYPNAELEKPLLGDDEDDFPSAVETYGSNDNNA